MLTKARPPFVEVIVDFEPPRWLVLAAGGLMSRVGGPASKRHRPAPAGLCSRSSRNGMLILCA